MGIVDGVGFHGTDQTYSLGTAASHGCLRMAVGDITEMYDMVPVGTPVYIG
jgi:lipoprotein-anchoring transpeptidase ErfK/SrfK